MVIVCLLLVSCAGNDQTQFRKLIREHEKLLSEGRYDAAAFAAQRACNFAAKEFGAKSEQLSLAQNDLALTLKHMERYTEAESLLVSACQIDSLGGRVNTVGFATQLFNLGQVYTREKKYPEAERTLRQSQGLREQLLGKDHKDVSMCVSELAWTYIEQERWADAKPLSERSLAIDKRTLAPVDPNLGIEYSLLQKIYYHLRVYDSAEYCGNRAVEILSSSLGEKHPYTIYAICDLARVFHAERKLAQADSTYSTLLRVAANGTSETRKLMTTYVAEYADMLEQMGDKEKAQRVREMVNRPRVK